MSGRATQVGNHVDAGLTYCEKVSSGKIPACKWVKQAAKRHLDEFYDPPEGLHFDPNAAHQSVEFIQTLPHTKGEWSNRAELLALEPWQKFILTAVFGWMRDDGLRRFRTVYIEVPRKNGKSCLSAGVGLHMLRNDAEHGAEVYSVATKRDQARIVFDHARQMALRKDLLDVVPFRHNLHIDDPSHPSVGSKFEPLSAEGSTMDGFNISCAINDELHAWQRRDVYDVLDTATGSRAQPLIWNITTAGSNLEGICYELREYVCRILDGVISDDTLFGCIWTIDEDDDWTSEAAWKKANPNYGVSVYPLDIKRLCKKAQEMPSEQNAFLTKRLNVWCNADEAWMNMQHWDQCANHDLRIEDFAGQECWLGVDLASKNDIASVAQLFRDTVAGEQHVYAFTRNYLPEAAVRESQNVGHYDGWRRSGRLVVTPGNILDIDAIEAECAQMAEDYNVIELAFDPLFNATQFGVHMAEHGLLVVEVRPSVLNFSEPMKWMEAYVLDDKWHHNGDPVMTWAVSNIVCHTDAKDNIFPNKPRRAAKIDPVIASLMAFNRLLAAGEGSIYDERGVWTV